MPTLSPCPVCCIQQRGGPQELFGLVWFGLVWFWFCLVNVVVVVVVVVCEAFSRELKLKGRDKVRGREIGYGGSMLTR